MAGAARTSGPGPFPGAFGDRPVLVDLGTSTVTGVRASGAPGLAPDHGQVAHPVLHTVPLDAAATAALGSDFSRAGLLFDRPALTDDDTFTDPLGIEWLWADGGAAPLNHPLEQASYLDVARHPRPKWPSQTQFPPGSVGSLVVVDAPVSGLLETCFGLRGSWQFMTDITDDWRVANALLDWALETVAQAYEHLLTTLPAGLGSAGSGPDVVLYGDDYGYQAGMFLSDQDFRTFVLPRLRTLFSRIRRHTGARICFHCCGAVRAILPDLADLVTQDGGDGILNLQRDAKDMDLDRVREAIPRQTILHGYTDLLALGQAVRDHDRRGVAILAGELVASRPAVAAPADCLATEAELVTAAAGARFVRALSAEDIDDLRRFGPVAAILDRATEAAAGSTPREGNTQCPDR